MESFKTSPRNRKREETKTKSEYLSSKTKAEKSSEVPKGSPRAIEVTRNRSSGDEVMLTRIARRFAKNQENRQKIWTRKYEDIYMKMAEQRIKTENTQWRKAELERILQNK
jgi:hypothetical protein